MFEIVRNVVSKVFVEENLEFDYTNQTVNAKKYIAKKIKENFDLKIKENFGLFLIMDCQDLELDEMEKYNIFNLEEEIFGCLQLPSCEIPFAEAKKIIDDAFAFAKSDNANEDDLFYQFKQLLKQAKTVVKHWASQLSLVVKSLGISWKEGLKLRKMVGLC